MLLTWSKRDQKLLKAWAANHTTTVADGSLVLALDTYEHSYHIDYSAKVADYVGVFRRRQLAERPARLRRSVRLLSGEQLLSSPSDQPSREPDLSPVMRDAHDKIGRGCARTSRLANP